MNELRKLRENIFYLSRGLEMMHPRTGIEQRPRLFKRQQYVTLGNERKFDPARLREGRRYQL